MDSKKMPKFFECIKCDFSCSKKSNYDAHLLTLKHKSSKMDSKKMPNYYCSNCGKEYQTKSGSLRHEKSCKNAKRSGVIDLIEDNKELRQLLMKQQEESHVLLGHIKEQHKQIQELIPRIGNVTNQQFNVNIFLNEQCKDAINWDDFMRQLNWNVRDLELTPDRMIKMICNEIEDLGIYKRPIHCLNVKQKKLCIKNENQWEKNPQKVQDTLQKTNVLVQQKYKELLKNWEEENPYWHTNERDIEQYTMIVSNMTDLDTDLYANELIKYTYLIE